MRMTNQDMFRVTRLLLATAAFSGTAIGCVNEPPPNVTEEHPEVIINEPLVLHPNARLPEDDTALTSVDVLADRVVIGYTGTPMIPIAVGNVIGGHRDGGYLRRVTAVNDMGDGRIEYITVDASLQEALSAGDFEIRWVGGDAVPPGGEGDVLADPQAVRFALGGQGAAANNWCNAAGGGSIEVLPTLTSSVSPNYRIRMSPEFSATVTLNGSVTAGVTVNASANGTVNCAANLGTILSPSQLDAISWHSTRSLRLGSFFTVDIEQRIQPFADLSVNGNINTGRTTATISGQASLRAGFEYAGGFNGIWEPRFRTTGNFTALEGGAAHLDATVRAGITYQITLGAFGVGVRGEARLGAEVGGTADVNTCDWTLNAHANASAGLTAGALGFNFSRDWPLGTPVMFSRMGRVRTCSDTRGDAGPPVDSGMAGTPAGGACMTSPECAGANICARNGGASKVCCVGAAGAATMDSQCCGTMTVVGGHCALRSRTQTCEQTADCQGSICRQPGGALCGTATNCTCQ